MKMILLFFVMAVMVASCGQRTIEEPTFCPAVYDPVCGSNGITYGNSCEAEKAGITDYTAGECNDDMVVPLPIEACPAVYEPVCGQPPWSCEGDADCTTVDPDPITYANECEMIKAGAELLYEGECSSDFISGDLVFCTPEQLAAQICTREYMPVCGDDGITYGNKCEACAGDAIAYTPGACEADVFFCSAEEKAAEFCTLEYMPVCGDDGITYGNRCAACTSQVDSYTIGECD